MAAAMTTERLMTGRAAPAKAATEPRTFLGLPSHVIVMFAASTAGYALLLAAVAGFQSHGEGLLVAARQPAVDGVAQLRVGHDDLATNLDAAQADYNAAVAAYVAAGGSLDTLTSKLTVLSTLVGKIDGVSRSMPAAVKLPTVHTSVGSVRSPSTQSTTGASGG